MKMKTRYKIIIPTIVILTVVLLFLFITANGFSFYNEGLHVDRYSTDELKKDLKADYMKGVQIQIITDDDLKSVPKIKELIEKSLTKEFPVNRTGKVLSDKDTLKKYHQYYAIILAEKYSKDPEEFVRILPAHPSDLEEYPDTYKYEFDGDYFEYNGIQYGWSNSHFIDYGKDNLANIESYKVNNPLDSERHTWAILTDEDFEKMPLLLLAINNIGTLQENIEVQNSMPSAEVDRYKKWFAQNITSNIFEYDGNYFRIGFWIA